MKYATQRGVFAVESHSEALDQARSHDLDGLEFNLSVDGLRTEDVTLGELEAEADRIARAAADAGMGVVSITPGLVLKHTATPDVLRAGFELTRRAGTRVLRAFSSPYVRLGGPNSTLSEWNAEFDGQKNYWHWFESDLANLQTWVTLAQEYDVRVVLELHGGFIVNSASGAYNILRHFDPRFVGVLHDPGNMVREGLEGWRMGLEIIADYLEYFHCKNTQFVRDENNRWTSTWADLDDGIADYAEIMSALKDLSWDGYLSIEDLRRDVSVEHKLACVAYLKGLEASDECVLPA